MHVEFHKVIKLIKNNKLYEIFVKIGNRGTFTRLSCSPAIFQIYLWKYSCGKSCLREAPKEIVKKSVITFVAVMEPLLTYIVNTRIVLSAAD